MSYYDVESILTDAEKIPCVFEIDIPYLGHLDNSPSGLKAPHPVILPLWLAELLALVSTSSSSSTSGNPSAPLTLKFPPSLGDAVIAALKADPRAVALRDQSAHFYGAGARMLELMENPELADALRRTFAVRAAEVGVHARKGEEGFGGGAVGAGWGEEFLRGLEEWERGLFRRAHEGRRGAKEWLDRVKR